MDDKHDMEKKLHEQYAEINNDSMGAIVSIIVALIAIFATYGYMFLHTSLQPACDFGSFIIENPMTCHSPDIYTIEILMLIAATALFAICIIHILCIYVGFSRRVDQFSAHAIRVKLGFFHELLTNSYNPHGYSYYNFIPGLYKKFIQIFSVLKWLLVGLTLLKIRYVECWSFPVTKISLVIFLIMFVVTEVVTLIFYNRKYKVYRELEGEFSWYRIQELKYYKDMEENCEKCICCCSEAKKTQNEDKPEKCAGCFISRRFPPQKNCIDTIYIVEIILMLLIILMVLILIFRMTSCCC